MIFDQYCEHQLARVGNDYKLQPVTGFDWTELERRIDGEPEEETASSAYGEALIAILAWIVGDQSTHPDSPFGISSRAIGLAWMLRPDLVPFRGITDIAHHCAVTKQSLSKNLSEFRQSANWSHARHFKGEGSTENYRKAAKEGWKTRLMNLKNREVAAGRALSEPVIAE